MNEKVLLTVEQAKAFDKYRNEGFTIETFVNAKQSFGQTFISLKELSINDFASAYHIGYEIEKPKFKAGDYVFVNWASGRDIHRVLKVNDNGEVVLDQEYPRNCHPRMELVQPTTTEEAYWLGELGRKCVGDFKNGDIYIQQNNDCYLVGSDVFADRASDWYVENDDFKGIYPAESFKPFPEEESE